MNLVILSGRLSRDTELRVLPSGKSVTMFTVVTTDYRNGQESHQYHAVVTWDRLAQICGTYLDKGMLVSIIGSLKTRQWEDDRKIKHYRTEIIADKVEMLSGRMKDDFAAETADATIPQGMDEQQGER